MSDTPEAEHETRSEVRQVRLKPSQWTKVQEKAKELRIPASKLMALAIMRGIEGKLPELDGDLKAYQELEGRLAGGTG